MAKVDTSSSRPYHIVIFGASGFTGQFVVEEVARTVSEGPNGTLKWAVAGRSRQKLDKVLEQAAGTLGTYQSNVFIKPFLHQQMSQSAMQRLRLKPQTASNAGVEARWLGNTS